jgi:hypothetical protein
MEFNLRSKIIMKKPLYKILSKYECLNYEDILYLKKILINKILLDKSKVNGEVYDFNDININITPKSTIELVRILAELYGNHNEFSSIMNNPSVNSNEKIDNTIDNYLVII